jgi:glycosyltransferase involved in cell wall biosynthesis
MRRYVADGKLAWLPNPLRRPDPAARPLPAGRPFFLAVGRLDRQKAYDVLLDAFAQVAAVRDDVDLVILGQGPLHAALEEQARRLGIDGRVRFMGRVADPFPWYRAAIALAHPARFEGMPNAVLEAMSVGLPPVVSDAQEGLRGIVHDRSSCLKVSVGSAASLAAAMNELLQDHSLRDELSSGARKSIEANFTGAVEKWTEIICRERMGTRAIE